MPFLNAFVCKLESSHWINLFNDEILHAATCTHLTEYIRDSTSQKRAYTQRIVNLVLLCKWPCWYRSSVVLESTMDLLLFWGGERFCSLRQIRISFLINFQWSKINHQKDIPNGTTWTQNIITGFSSKTIIINSERFTPLSAYKADVCYLNSILQYFFYTELYFGISGGMFVYLSLPRPL